MGLLDLVAYAIEPRADRRGELAVRLAKSVRFPDLTRDAMRSISPLGMSGSYIQPGHMMAPSLRNRPLLPEWSGDRLAREGFRSSGYVYRCVNAIASNAASVPLTTWRATTKGKSQDGRRRAEEYELDADSPLTALLEEPNPMMSRQEFFERVYQQLALRGNALVYAGRLLEDDIPKVQGFDRNVGRYSRFAGEGPAGDLSDIELWPLVTTFFSPIPNNDGEIVAYRYEGGEVRFDIPADRILHVQLPDPDNLFWGLSPLKVLERQINTDSAALDWNNASLATGAVASTVFKYKGQFQSQEEYNSAKARIVGERSGPEASGIPWVTDGDWDVDIIDRSPREMDFVNSRKFTREEIMSVFGVPPVVAGFFDQATLANAEVSRRLFWKETVLPNYVGRFTGACERQLAWRYEEGRDVWLKPDLSAVEALREDNSGKVTTLKALVNEIGTPYNDAAEFMELDLPRIDGAVGESSFGLVRARAEVQAGVPPGNGSVPALQPARSLESENEHRRDQAREDRDGEWKPRRLEAPVDAGRQSEAAGDPPAVAVESGDAAATAASSVQETALNGAQVTSLLAIVQQVTAGQLPIDSAEALIQAAFPGVASDVIARILDGLAGFQPPAADAKPEPVKARRSATPAAERPRRAV